jgi:hypothetical protein
LQSKFTHLPELRLAAPDEEVALHGRTIHGVSELPVIW